MNTTNNSDTKKNKGWIGRIIFIIIHALLYTWFFYYIIQNWGMGTIVVLILGSFILLSVPMAVAHLLFRKWWLSFVGLVVGIFLTWFIYLGEQYYKAHKLNPYVNYYYGTEKINVSGQQNVYGRQGEFTTYDTAGNITSIATYTNSRINKCQLFYPNGKLKASGNLINGYWGENEWAYHNNDIPDGKWVYYREDSTIDDERKYDNGKLLLSKNYTLLDDDSLGIITISNGLPYTGILNKTAVVTKGLFPPLITCKVVNGYFEGVDTEYYNMNGKYRLGTITFYQNQKLNGEMKRYHENGQLQSIRKYINGKLEGECMSYYADSLPIRIHGNMEYICNYKNGERNGTARWFFANGKLKMSSDYVDGIRNGIDKEYRENGKLWYIYRYQKGNMEGKYVVYNKDGSYQKGIYRNGQCIEFNDYDKHGKLIK